MIYIVFLNFTSCGVLLDHFPLFDDKETELSQVENKKTKNIFKLNAYPGNATASSTLKVYRIKEEKTQFMNALETMKLYKKEKSRYYINDSTMHIILLDDKEIDIDTFQVSFILDTIYLDRIVNRQKLKLLDNNLH